jgi:hypothetical protein
LFFAQLKRVIALVAFELNFSGVLARRNAAALEGALGGHTAIALEIELLALATTKPAYSISITCQESASY